MAIQQQSSFQPVATVPLPVNSAGKPASPTSTIGILTNQVNELINAGNSLGYDTSSLASSFNVAVNQYSRTKDTKYIGQFQSQLQQNAKSINELSLNRKKEQDKIALAEREKVADAIVNLNVGLGTLDGRGVQVSPELAAKIEELNSGQVDSTQAQTIAGLVESLVRDTDPEKLASARQKQMEAEKLAKEQSQIDADKQRLLDKINKFITPQGKPNEKLQDATGFGEAVGTWFGKLGIGLGNAPETIRMQQELAIIIEKDLLEATKFLKPVANDEIAMLKANRPSITDPPEVWAGYLSEIKSIIEKDRDLPDTRQQSTQQVQQSPTSAANAFFERFNKPQGAGQ